MADFSQIASGMNPDATSPADTLTGDETLIVKQNGVPVETTAQDVADLGGGGGGGGDVNGIVQCDGASNFSAVTIGDGLDYTDGELSATGGGGSGTVTIDVTTGAMPVDIPLQDSTVQRVIVNVTSGGTAEEEVLNLLPGASPDGARNGQRVTINFVTQTDPGDTINVKIDSSDGASQYRPNQVHATFPGFSKVILDYVGGAAEYVQAIDGWVIDPGATNVDFTYQSGSGSVIIQGRSPDTVDTNGQNLFLSSGSANGNGDGGSLVITTGADGGSGHGGDLTITLGNGNTRKGLLTVSGLPTADPSVVGAIFTVGSPSAGVPKALMISGG